MVLYVKPRPLVLWFVLYPYEFFYIGILLHFCLELFMSEGVKLFNANNGNIIAFSLFSLCDQIIINFTRANHDTLYFFWINVRIHFANNRKEHAFSKIF